MTTAAQVSFKNSSAWVSLLNLIYPVGTVYSSYSNNTPANKFGGTWAAITGYFPYYNAGNGTGGANTKTIAVGNLPAHTHNIRAYVGGQAASGGWISGVVAPTETGSGTKWYASSSTGSGTAFNVMPAYQTLYAWRRTA